MENINNPITDATDAAKSLMKPFKRTTSRLYELTSIKNDYL